MLGVNFEPKEEALLCQRKKGCKVRRFGKVLRTPRVELKVVRGHCNFEC